MTMDVSSLSEEAQSLARVPLFKRLEADELERLAEEIDQVNYKAGETIFNEHDRGDALYILEEGSVRIWVYDEDVKEVTLAELKPGVTEILFHASLPTEDFPLITGSSEARRADLKALTNPRVKQLIQERGILLTTWKELKERRKKAAAME